MSRNLLLWQWSEDYDTAAKRKRQGVRFSDVTAGFAADESHPAIGRADVAPLLEALAAEFDLDANDGLLVVERHEDCIVLNYSDRVRQDVVPLIGGIAKHCGFEAGEF